MGSRSSYHILYCVCVVRSLSRLEYCSGSNWPFGGGERCGEVRSDSAGREEKVQ